ncbi:hypothetical protein FHETE_804 [Fusarium heterosporum]|uniref:Uncharacterized protein n=1 Tax=Fusarium heterosporum TaxID=42747 RepID=A0A8H5U3Z9_FUSHE|nr:hypothetical protein FHETE_804 [Fusarium heterosporum]
MAIPYPEGEVFFARSVLRNSNPNHYQADNVEHFYSHFMVEYIWNVEADHGSKNANSPHGHSHPRSGYSIVRGGGIQAWFMTMLMPTKDERWVWIDMLTPIRAIYIPVAHSASEDHPGLSTWLQVSFVQPKNISIWREGSTFTGHQTDSQNGLRVYRNFTVGFDFTGLTELLCCPRQFRKVNVFQAKFVKIVPASNIRTVSVAASYNDAYDFDWATITRAHSGLNIEWGKGEQGSWFEDFFKNALTFGIGFIPGIGPMLAIAFSLTWTAIRDPDKFMHELSLWVPSVKIPELFDRDVRASAGRIKGLVHESMWQSRSTQAVVAANKYEAEEKQEKEASGGVQSYFEYAGKELKIDQAKYDKTEGDAEPGEIIAEIEPRDFTEGGSTSDDLQTSTNKSGDAWTNTPAEVLVKE